jgi:glycerophosphoryl diester phosphodiesterase
MPNSPKIAYHRGRHGKMPDGKIIPENSLIAFDAAIKEGAQIIEFDVERDTFICHDADIPNEAPKLKDVLNLTQGKCLLNIEIKNPLASKEVISILKDALQGPIWKPEHFVLSTFDHTVLLECRKSLPNLRVGALFEGVLLPSYIDLLAEQGINNIHTEWRTLLMDAQSGSALKSAARKNNMEIWVYTVNSKSIYDALVKYGVDVIFTDKPELFK